MYLATVRHSMVQCYDKKSTLECLIDMGARIDLRFLLDHPGHLIRTPHLSIFGSYLEPHSLLPHFVNRKILPTLSNFSGKVFLRLFYLNFFSKPKRFRKTLSFVNIKNDPGFCLCITICCFLSIKQRPVQGKISELDLHALLLHVYITSDEFVFTRKYF